MKSDQFSRTDLLILMAGVILITAVTVYCMIHGMKLMPY